MKKIDILDLPESARDLIRECEAQGERTQFERNGRPVAVLVSYDEYLALRETIENEVRYANIMIIEGHDASQYGIGIVSARIGEMILNDERAVIPIGSFQRQFGVTLSLPSIVGRDGVLAVLEPELSDAEQKALRKSAETLKSALEGLNKT